MHSWMCLALMAALALNVSLALPLNLNDVVETAETDEQLLALLAGQSIEDESASAEHARTRRMPIEDPDLVVGDRHPDELAHERRGERHFGRERRAAGKNSSGSSEEVGKAQQTPKTDESNSSSEESKKIFQPQPQHDAGGEITDDQQVRRRRSIVNDLIRSFAEHGEGHKLR